MAKDLGTPPRTSGISSNLLWVVVIGKQQQRRTWSNVVRRLVQRVVQGPSRLKNDGPPSFSKFQDLSDFSPERNKRDLSYLENLPGAVERLRIVNADLSDPDSLGPAIKGCVGVFHMAHLIDYTMGSPEKTVMQIAVRGLLWILTACLTAKTVKRVVYTATTSAVLFHGKDLGVTNKGMWSDLEVCRKSPLYPNYLVSKTLTEDGGGVRRAERIGGRHLCSSHGDRAFHQSLYAGVRGESPRLGGR
ncbi:hypothetical protein NL676_011794 [Syzygium grande]|nr:hypothetical protein NL676_011794 [Syzygium grande]